MYSVYGGVRVVVSRCDRVRPAHRVDKWVIRPRIPLYPRPARDILELPPSNRILNPLVRQRGQRRHRSRHRPRPRRKPLPHLLLVRLPLLRAQPDILDPHPHILLRLVPCARGPLPGTDGSLSPQPHIHRRRHHVPLAPQPRRQRLPRIVQHPQHRIFRRLLPRPGLRRCDRARAQPRCVGDPRGSTRLCQRSGVLGLEVCGGDFVQQPGFQLFAEACVLDGAAAGAASGEQGFFGRLFEAASHGPLSLIHI